VAPWTSLPERELPDGRSAEDRALRALLLLLGIGSLVPVWAVRFLPLQDLPNHLLKVDLLERFLRREAWVDAIYAPNLRPVANATCYAVILLLAPLVGKMAASKIFVSACLALMPAAAYRWLRRVNPENALLALATPAMGFNLFLMMGNLNFCCALMVYVAALAALAAPARGRFPAAFTLLATLLYFTHGFVFMILAGVTGCLLALSFSRDLLRKAAGLLPGLLLMIGTLLFSLLSGPGGAGALRPAFARPRLDLARLALVWLLNPHGWGYDTVVALGWVGALGGATLWTLATLRSAGAPSPRRNDLLRRNPWLVVAALLALGYLLAPGQLRDWWHLKMRFSPLLVLALLGGVRLPKERGIRIATAALFVAAALAIQMRNLQEFRKRSGDVEEYLAGIDAVEEGSSLLPMENLEPGPKYRVNLHSWAYYLMAKRGWAPYLHAQPAYNPVTYRVTPWAPGEGGAVPGDEALRRAAACYDYVILWNPRPGDARALRRYFDLRRAHKRLRIWRNSFGRRGGAPADQPACVADSAAAGAPSAAGDAGARNRGSIR
jgi:hypothetical protein